MLKKIVLGWLGCLFVPLTFAASTAPAHAQGGTSQMLFMVIAFGAIFYFLLVRPQSKRAKEQKQLMDDLSVGDEVVTAGGVVGRISKLKDNYVFLSIAKDTSVMFQKSSIATILPKGTVDIVS